MGDGIYVPTDKLTSTAQVFEALSTSAGQVHAALQDAHPDPVLWGLLGQLLKPMYESKAVEADRHIGKIAEALSSQGKAIQATADNHRDLDEATAAAFQRFLDKLAGGN
ncbi:hypothetical protein [Catenuloplanes indicus]|uniref:Uncharacterized protein YukE n=1 Tax=Catenuloplanes indicus TaxID=137267 RepID=A0AAE3VTY8_9ACTN|nr:hypothetical protein [Catenuloplanes indicus]MDQ0363627.1 uncharacterized protein YukE [Catenuloplanes indicus]